MRAANNAAVNRIGRDRLADLQTTLLSVVASVDDEDCRTQFDAFLSPLGWHLRHCVFVEALWLRERVMGDDRLTSPLLDLCLPERAPKEERGAKLPQRTKLLDWANETMAENLRRLAHVEHDNNPHPLIRGGYLREFLVAHHAQHLETMRMALTARAAARRDGHQVSRPLKSAPPVWSPAFVEAGQFTIGADQGFSYDNESPRQQVTLDQFTLAATPVTNAQYCGFMDAGGYSKPQWWTSTGRAWRDETGVEAPHGWFRDPAGHWFSVGPDGAHDLAPDATVVGLSRHEAMAFAAWAGGGATARVSVGGRPTPRPTRAYRRGLGMVC